MNKKQASNPIFWNNKLVDMVVEVNRFSSSKPGIYGYDEESNLI